MTPSDMVPHNGDELGEHGEPCSDCGSPLADDQRYCLNCGRRRAGERVAYAELLSGREATEVLVTEETEEPPSRRPGQGLLGGLAALAGAIVLGLGVLIGVLLKGDDERPITVNAPAAKAPVVNVTAGTGGGEAATGAEFVSDWPEGKSGHTVQLQTLPSTSDTADVDAAKTEAEGKGATKVGALNSDEYASLEPGNYVVYSGVFTGKGSEGKAKAALKKLKKEFSDAKVVKVSSGDEEFAVADEKPEEKVEVVDDSKLKELENATGEQQQKLSQKLPDTIGTGGKPPPDEPDKGGGQVFE